MTTGYQFMYLYEVKQTFVEILHDIGLKCIYDTIRSDMYCVEFEKEEILLTDFTQGGDTQSS